MKNVGNFRGVAVFHSLVRRALLLGLGLFGCGARTADAPARSAVPAAIPAVLPVDAQVAAPPPRSLGPNRCLPNGAPKPRTAAKLYAATTCVDHRSVERALARKLAKQYDPTVTGSAVDVSFDCDPLTSEIEEVLLETGAGHGGNLELWRLHRKSGQSDFDVLGIGNVGYYARPREGELPLRIGRGSISGPALEKALATARPALTARIRELEPPPNGLWGRNFSTSSGNFHLYFRLSDGSHELIRHFTGYPGSSDQSRYLGLEEANAAIAPLLEKIPLTDTNPNDEVRELFVRAFLAAVPRFDDEFAWWVRDRYVALAEHLGTPELVPALAGVLESGLREAERETAADRKQTVLERRLAQPLATLARITGWDPRKNDSGATRETAEVAREVLAECAGERKD